MLSNYSVSILDPLVTTQGLCGSNTVSCCEGNKDSVSIKTPVERRDPNDLEGHSGCGCSMHHSLKWIIPMVGLTDPTVNHGGIQPQNKSWWAAGILTEMRQVKAIQDVDEIEGRDGNGGGVSYVSVTRCRVVDICRS